MSVRYIDRLSLLSRGPLLFFQVSKKSTNKCDIIKVTGQSFLAEAIERLKVEKFILVHLKEMILQDEYFCNVGELYFVTSMDIGSGLSTRNVSERNLQ